MFGQTPPKWNNKWGLSQDSKISLGHWVMGCNGLVDGRLHVEGFPPKSPVQESVQVIDAFEGAFEDEEKARELKRFITHLVAPLKDGAVYV